MISISKTHALLLVSCVFGFLSAEARRVLADPSAPADSLIRAYPEQIERIEDGVIVWRDGSRMDVGTSAGKGPATTAQAHADWLQGRSPADMLRLTYVPGQLSKPPARFDDPGRARHMPFFVKMYGDCRKGGVRDDLVSVPWLEGKKGGWVQVTRINGVAKRVRAISKALDALPARFDAYLRPPGGGFNCRRIAGTGRLSAHAFGIAIDIAVGPAHYWKWSKPGADGRLPYSNAIPHEIVEIFERHGFIWGGKWYHFDTMHFEYRPEMLAPAVPLSSIDN